MNRLIPFDEDAVCDGCGNVGAFDFMGDDYCGECMEKTLGGDIPKCHSEVKNKEHGCESTDQICIVNGNGNAERK